MDEGKICCMMWKDKKCVLMLSTHAEPIPPTSVTQTVYRKVKGRQREVNTRPMDLEYETNM